MSLATPQPTSPLDPPRWVERHGHALYAFAVARLRDAHAAENAVQETFLAALRARHGYSGRSTERTWLTGILKHKVADALRARQREGPDALEDDDIEARLFDAKGRWIGASAVAPERSAAQARLRQVLTRCIERLPARLCEAFVLREVAELDPADVSAQLGVTPGNLAVLLHRARLRLRACVTAEGGEPC